MRALVAIVLAAALVACGEVPEDVTCDLTSLATGAVTPVFGCTHPLSHFYCALSCSPGCVGH